MAGVKGKSGRKRQPASILKLRGTFRADRQSGANPEPPTAIPTPPKMLTGIALEEWDRITKLLAEAGCIAELDRTLLAAYCIEWAKFAKANGQLRLCKSMLARTTKGSKQAHPLLGISNRAFANLLRICGEFGLSPAARARLSIEAKAAGDDPLERLLRSQIERREASLGRPD